MANKLQLHVPEPCHESWENMSPVEKGRFCSSCQKQVVDFSVMSDRQIAQFFKQPLTNSVCGHFSGTQLNRDIDLPKKRIPWIKYFFQVAIPAFLVSSKAKGQRNVLGEMKSSTTCATPTNPMIQGDIAYVEIATKLTGKVTDETGEPVRNATIRSKSTNRQIKTDNLGLFTLAVPSNMKEDQLTVTANGYLSSIITITKDDWRRGSASITLYNQINERMVYGITMPVRRTKQIPIIDTITNLFTSSRINPNSIYPGDAFKVEWKSKDEKKIYVSVCDADNKMLLFIPYDVVKGNNSLPVNTNQQWKPGNYTVKLLDVLGKQLLSEKLTLQVRQDEVVKPKEIRPVMVKGKPLVNIQKPVITSVKQETVAKIDEPKTTINSLSQLSTTRRPTIAAFDNVFMCRFPGVMIAPVEAPVINKTFGLPVTVVSVGKIMPNPVKQGQTFMVEWKGIANEKLLLRISAIDGKELMTMPVAITKGINRIPVNTDNNWLPGIYVVVLYNEKGKLLLSEKIIIE